MRKVDRFRSFGKCKKQTDFGPFGQKVDGKMQKVDRSRSFWSKSRRENAKSRPISVLLVKKQTGKGKKQTDPGPFGQKVDGNMQKEDRFRSFWLKNRRENAKSRPISVLLVKKQTGKRKKQTDFGPFGPKVDGKMQKVDRFRSIWSKSRRENPKSRPISVHWVEKQTVKCKKQTDIGPFGRKVDGKMQKVDRFRSSCSKCG